MASKAKIVWLVQDMYNTIYVYSTEKKAREYIADSGYPVELDRVFYLSEDCLHEQHMDTLKLSWQWLR